MGAGKTVEKWDSWTAEMKARHGNSNGHGKSLSIKVRKLLPTPTAWLGRRPSQSIGDAERWNNKERSRELSDCIAATMVQRLLPTPTTGDSKVFGPNNDWKKRQENHHPSTASALMALRLNDGNESSADAPPIPPTNAV
jgi:hypothetical protein